MENIVGVIDMDGFRIQKRFLCKELGLLKVGDDTASSFVFDIGVRWSDLDKKDTRCCKYLIRKSINFRWEYLVAHRLTLWRHWKSWSLIFTKAYKRDGKSTLAYKGGILERDLLKRLGIPSVNLECFGCPTAEALFDALVWLETCGNHTKLNAYHHCAKVEVEAFGHWLTNQVHWWKEKGKKTKQTTKKNGSFKNHQTKLTKMIEE